MVQIAHNFEISYKHELQRKGIHMVSLSIPIIYYFVSKEFALWVLIPMTIISIIIDFASRKKNKFREIYHKFFGHLLRPHEYYDVFTLNGATWVLISAVACIMIFPKLLMISAFSILIISDISSALIGRRYGKHKLFVGKSWEGTTAFWITSILVILFIGIVVSAPWTFYLFGIIAAILGGIAEAASTMLKLDDNISIPITIGFSMWAGGLLAEIYFHLPFINII